MTNNRRLSRRGLLTKGAVVGAAVAVAGAKAPAHEADAEGPAYAAAMAQAPAVVTNRLFKAWISRGTGRNRTTLQEVRLRSPTGRQVVVRTQATNLCYSNSALVLGLQDPPPPAAGAGGNSLAAGTTNMALIQGHGGIGVVEAVGPDVRRVQIGDRVCVSGTPQCGSCYHCLRGRADVCQLLGRNLPSDFVPIADMRDGTPVYANSHIGGLAELMVTFEEWVVPIVSTAPAVDLGMVLGCVSVAGLGATTSGTLAQVRPGSSVAVVGCGPLGLSAVQGARIAGASTIIAIDPVTMRRDVALKVGATHVLDPNAESNVIEKVRSLTAGPTSRAWSGGRDSGGRRSGAGADLVVEAVGLELATPRVERGPDPTGILPVQQAYEMASSGGDVITTGLIRGTITLPAFLFAIGGVSHHGGQAGGANPMRDIPRFVEMLHSSRYDTQAMVTRTVPLADMLGAYEEVIYRQVVTAIMTA